MQGVGYRRGVSPLTHSVAIFRSCDSRRSAVAPGNVGGRLPDDLLHAGPLVNGWQISNS